MLIVKNQGHFDRVVAFAERTNQADALWEQLFWLARYGGHFEGDEAEVKRRFRESGGIDQTTIRSPWVVELSWDFAPASFGLCWLQHGNPAMQGGLIYHGSQAGWDDSGRQVDPLSVALTIDPEHPWQIHT